MRRKSGYYHQYNFEEVYGKVWESCKPGNSHKEEDGQLSIEDLFDFSVLGIESREEYIHRKMSQLPKCRIMQRTIISGRQLELDIYPVYLLKACLAGDIDKMEKFGIYEVIEEDLALCEFVCPSKIGIQSILTEGINLMLKEMA